MRDIYETITIYRYISLVITSICYLMNTPTHNIGRKVLVIGAMTFSAILMNYLYKVNQDNKHKMLVLVLTEIIGDSLLIIPSGGIYSPYIWYVFNAILVAGVELKKDYIHIILMIYMGCIMVLSGIWPHKVNQTLSGTQYTLNMAIGIIFAGLVVQVISNYAREVEKKKDEMQSANKELKEAKLKSEESLQWLMDTYEVMNLFTIYNTKSEMMQMLLDYMVNVLQIPKVAFIEKAEGVEFQCTYSQGMEMLDEEQVLALFKEKYKRYKIQNKPVKTYYPLNKKYLCLMVGCSYEEFGYFIVEADEINEGLIFVKQLSDLIFKKLNLEKIEEALLINKEQNRIANEIHDSVLQQLFGIGCNLFSLEKRLAGLEKQAVEEEIKYSRQAINKAMTELRKIIYGMSWNKQGINQFAYKLQSYITEIRHLYDSKITFNMQGNLQDIGIKEQGAIYRMICEGVANSVRHGKASNVSVDLSITPDEAVIRIIDDGIGFNYDEMKSSQSVGLGMRNIEGLAAALGGLSEIDSKEGKGTKLKINLPIVHLKEGVAK